MLYVHNREGLDEVDVDFLERAFGEVFGVYDAEAWAEKGMWEHSVQDLPLHRANLHRRVVSYTETMYVSAFPAARVVIVAALPVRMREGHEMPGAIRRLPLGWRDLRDAETVRSRFEQIVGNYLDMGWIRTEHRP